MVFKFRKSLKIAPGVKLNLGKKSAGISIGGKYGGMSFNSKTGTSARASIPDTGISYSTKIGKSKKQKRSGKSSGCLTQIFSVLIFISVISACANVNNVSDAKETTYPEDPPRTEETVAETTAPENPYRIVDGFIDLYNAAYSDTKIENLTEATVSDKEGGYYRHEFRLDAFKNALSKAGSVGRSKILIVNYGSLGLNGLRIYITCDTQEEAVIEFFKVMPLLYPELTEDDISEVNYHIENWGDYSSIIGNWNVYINHDGANQDAYIVFFDDSLYTYHTND